MALRARRTCGPPRRRWPPRGRRACRGVWPAPRSPLAVRRSPARGRGGLRWARPPAPGQGRDATIAVREYGDAVGTDAHHEAPVVPGGSGAVGVAVDAYVAPLVRPCPQPPDGVEAHAREGHHRREIDGERLRRGLPGPVTGGGVGALAADAQPRVGPGHGRDGRNRDEEVPAKEADGVPDGPPLVSRVGVAEPRLEAVVSPRLREQPRLGHLPEEHPTGLGRVVEHHHARHPANELEDLDEPLAETLRPLAPHCHAVPRVRLPGRGREQLELEAPARDHGNEAAVVDLHGPRRPVELEVAIARRRPPRRPPPPREPADRRMGSGVALLLDEPVADPPRRMALLSRSREVIGEHLGDPACERIDRGLRPLGRERRRGRQVLHARVLCGGVAADAERAGDLGRSGPVGVHSSDTLSYVKGHGHPSLPPPGGWSRVSVPPGGIVGHGRAPCAGAWPRQCEYCAETDGRVARKLMRFLLSSY